MKTKVKVIILTFFIFCVDAYSQFASQRIISTSAEGAFRAIPFDMDSDGFIDVVSASYSDAKIAWYRNLDGQGSFGTEQIITNTALAIEGMELFDIDTDGDKDVLYNTNLDKIAWLENLDGFGNFGSERIISQTDYPYVVSASDFDSDGDLDVLAVLYNDPFNNRLVWYENIDGNGTFSTEIHIVTERFDSDTTIADLDNDGDSDIITSYINFGPSRIVWYENIDGQGNFSTEQEIYEFTLYSGWTDIHNITTTDINGDGKVDILIDTYHDDFPDYIYWLEHLNGQGVFSSPKFIHEKVTTLGSLRSYDLDGDGDKDVLVSFFWGADTSIAWIRNNDGLGNFEPKETITTEVDHATDATAGDINGDGELDVISASSFDHKIAWYENLGIIDVDELASQNTSIYPNPTTGIFSIQSEQTIMKIEIYNELGQLITFEQNNNAIDVSMLDQGLYFVKIINKSGFIINKRIVKI